MGIGTAVVFKMGGTMGGSDLGARLLRKFTGLGFGHSLLIIDGCVVLIAAIFFNVELALFGLIGLLATVKVIDIIQEGFSYTKAAMIISNRSAEVTQEIFATLKRGATILRGQGAYSGMERDVVLVVINQTEVAKLKILVNNIDPDAFVIITNVNEALGSGFKELSKSQQSDS
jgi:uncharacterized membrane-anchored protein YitT (DUF2179 family)